MSFLSSSKSKADKPKKEKKAKAPKEPKPKKEKKSKRKKDEDLSEEGVGGDESAEFETAAPPQPKVRVITPKRLDVYALILLLSWILLVAASILTYLDIASYNK